MLTILQGDAIEQLRTLPDESVLIELNPKYVTLIRQRCDVTPGLALA